MNTYLFALILSLIFLGITFKFMKNKKGSQLSKIWQSAIILMTIWCLALILQIIFSKKLNIPPIYFDYIAYTGVCFIPITIYFLGTTYVNTTIKLKFRHLFLLVIPILTLLILWTNNYHHWFYKNYSIYMKETVVGNWFYVYTLFEYILIFIGIYKLFKFTIINAGFFSKQSLIIVIAILIPVIANIIGTLQIIPMTIYVTPICFSITLFLLSIAIFKFNFLDAAPIALQKVVDRISDSYLILNENDVIIDFNKTFLTTFKAKDVNLRNKDITEFLKSSEYKINSKKIINAIKKAKTSSKTQKINETFGEIEKTFTIEISDLVSQGKYLGCIVLFKDITQHIQDMETIKNNQDMLIERERLASLGQMIGGISHNLKTPIFSIAGGLEAIQDLIAEYDASLDSPQVTKDDMREIGNDMNEWIEKLKKHLEYMSDIITAVKGQAVTFSENTNIDFHIDEAFKQVQILMQHDLKHSLTNLYTTNEVPETVALKGNMNGLIQVIDNLISNAIYAYKSMGKSDQAIDLSAKYIKSKNSIEIRVKDYGPGLPKEVQEKLFKEMITTKGKEGTGLGLFMSASNIKAQFKGNLSFETAENKGTTFIITLPAFEAENVK